MLPKRAETTRPTLHGPSLWLGHILLVPLQNVGRRSLPLSRFSVLGARARLVNTSGADSMLTVHLL